MKLHGERLDALAVAAEQEKARTTAEQECILVKDQLLQAQEEIQVNCFVFSFTIVKLFRL